MERLEEHMVLLQREMGLVPENEVQLMNSRVRHHTPHTGRFSTASLRHGSHHTIHGAHSAHHSSSKLKELKGLQRRTAATVIQSRQRGIATRKNMEAHILSEKQLRKQVRKEIKAASKLDGAF